jgi:hypothetical protein
MPLGLAAAACEHPEPADLTSVHHGRNPPDPGAAARAGARPPTCNVSKRAQCKTPRYSPPPQKACFGPETTINKAHDAFKTLVTRMTQNLTQRPDSDAAWGKEGAGAGPGQ